MLKIDQRAGSAFFKSRRKELVAVAMFPFEGDKKVPGIERAGVDGKTADL